MKFSSRILASALAAVVSIPASGWANVGHQAVGEIAQRHLTDAAREALMKYVGAPLSAISVDADHFRAYWTLDLGFIPSNPSDARVTWLTDFDFSSPLNISPWSHSITVDSSFVCYPTHNLDGAYVNNDAYYVDSLSRVLKAGAETMDPMERYKDIALITHFLGDMHCPMHIVYKPKDELKGAFYVTYLSKQVKMHNIWDSNVVNSCTTNPYTLATYADTFTEDRIAGIVAGDAYDWASDVARTCWGAHTEYKAGDTLPDDYCATHKELMFTEIRNAGYRLAKLFNDIFQ